MSEFNINEDDIKEGIFSKSKIPDKTEKEIKNLAMAMYKNEIFSSLHLHENEKNMIKSIFMPIGLMSSMEIRQLFDNGVANIYAYMKDASPRAINGLPIFFNCYFLTKNDSISLISHCEAINKTFGEYKND